ncbi:MAG: hypothetical protein JWP44_4389 [Mucilaginibacter sp.]|nr:hypothetical protein [Mucilaginibacter sp.]
MNAPLSADSRAALRLAKEALTHDVPGSCWATGPLTGNYIEDLIVCPGCRALEAIDAALSNDPACPDCHGKGGKLPNGVEYCNCD